MRRRAGGARTLLDAGSAGAQYAGLIVLAALILGSLYAVGVPERVRGKTSSALCRILGSNCPPEDQVRKGLPGNAPRAAGPAIPNSCVVSQDTKSHTSSYKILAVKHAESKSTMVQRNQDGSVAVLNTQQKGTGVDVRGGFGGELNGVGADATAGFSSVPANRTTATMTFPDEATHAWYDRELKKTLAEKDRNIWTLGMTAVPKYSNEEARDRVQREWNRAHPGRPIRRAVLHADGTDSGADADASFGPAKATGSKGSGFYQGTKVDDMGTPDDPKDDETTGYYEMSGYDEGEAGANLPSGHLKEGAGGRVYGRRDSSSFISITSKHGKPATLTVTERRPWVVGAKVGARQAAGKETGTGNRQWTYGGVTSTETVVDLRKHPDVFTKWRAAYATDRGPASMAAYDRAVRAYGSSARTDYRRREFGKGGVSGSATAALELVAGDRAANDDHWDLQDARYRRPGEKAWRPWVACGVKR